MKIDIPFLRHRIVSFERNKNRHKIIHKKMRFIMRNKWCCDISKGLTKKRVCNTIAITRKVMRE